MRYSKGGLGVFREILKANIVKTQMMNSTDCFGEKTTYRGTGGLILFPFVPSEF